MYVEGDMEAYRGVEGRVSVLIRNQKDSTKKVML